ncbi:MAG: hypothetical protein ACLFTE_00330 [Salinivenus sp.]
MADDPKESQYNQTRRQFEELGPEERARFLIEATASTIAQGIETMGRTLAHGLQEAVRQEGPHSDEASAAGPGPAEPETSQRQRPRGGSS